MALTYEPIATTTVGTGTSTITFNSIPGTYTDLRVIINRFSNTASGAIGVRFNNDTGTNYSYSTLYTDGAGTTTSSNSINATRINASSSGSPQPDLSTVDVFSYAGSTNKICLNTYSGNNNAATFEYIDRIVGLWRNTAAITRIDLFGISGGTNSFQVGTVVTIYGIKAA